MKPQTDIGKQLYKTRCLLYEASNKLDDYNRQRELFEAAMNEAGVPTEAVNGTPLPYQSRVLLCVMRYKDGE